jgi:hypothetical protein
MKSPMTNFFPHDITTRERDRRKKKFAFLCFFSRLPLHTKFSVSYYLSLRTVAWIILWSLLLYSAPHCLLLPQFAPSFSRPNVHSVVPAQFAGLPSHPHSSSVRPTAAKTHPAPPLHNASSPNDRPRLHALQPTRLTIPAYPQCVCLPARMSSCFPPPPFSTPSS